MNEISNVQPQCPQCGILLVRKGKVVDCGKYKKWVEDWHCPVHGVISTPQLPQVPPLKQGPAQAEPAA
jgi:hypothetical protein